MAIKTEVQARHQRIQELEAKGITSASAIAVALGVPLRTVQTDLQTLNLTWAASQRGIETRDQWKRRLVARAEKRYQELEAEWQRSKENKERTRQKEVDGAGDGASGKHSEREAATEGRLGDPAYMREARENDMLIAGILGLVVRRHEHGGPEGGRIPLELKVEDMTDEELVEIAKRGRRPAKIDGTGDSN